ncbi:DUF6941 family protein [Curtobacterium aetherium]|uniref:Uncharacterized protein n=1 Tax=Curtobacterium aetherium TaxID=2841594 RepID=A0ACD1E5K6_9MICO|nr:hypothetical protein [Curtobacterium sp. L6-1]QWS34049.1 hypothetical protein KM842_02265 [Curtobacterium sp. L6-1]
MIHLGAALLCDAATVRENLLHVLGGGVTRLPRPGFPAPLGADIALLLYVDGDSGVEVAHKVTGVCRLQGSDDEPVFGFEYTLRTVLGTEDGAQSVSAILPAANLGIPSAGAYQVEISVDDKSIGRIPFTATLDENMFADLGDLSG